MVVENRITDNHFTSRKNKYCNVSKMNMIMPNAHQSDAFVYSFPRITSGAKYSLVPTKLLVLLFLSFISLYKPKSVRQG